jgi:hypothetical protein
MDDVVCGKADLYLGHDHSLQWLQATCSGTELIVSGGRASTTAAGSDSPFQATAWFVYVGIRETSPLRSST